MAGENIEHHPLVEEALTHLGKEIKLITGRSVIEGTLESVEAIADLNVEGFYGTALAVITLLNGGSTITTELLSESTIAGIVPFPEMKEKEETL